MSDSILIYVFAIESESKIPPERLSIMRLLIPPLMTNRLPWSRGYFEFVENRGFELRERLPVHCFYSPTFRKFFDDDGNELDKKLEPCWRSGLESYRTIDDAISRALEVPLASD